MGPITISQEGALKALISGILRDLDDNLAAIPFITATKF
jgi:hypothetical protein